MKSILILLCLFSNMANSQTKGIGDLVTGLQDMAFWDYSRVKIELISKQIPFEENVFNSNQKAISVSQDHYQIRFTFIDEKQLRSTIRFTVDQGGNDIKEVYYAFLGIYPQNAYGQWIKKLGMLTVYTTYSEKINGFIISTE